MKLHVNCIIPCAELPGFYHKAQSLRTVGEASNCYYCFDGKILFTWNMIFLIHISKDFLTFEQFHTSADSFDHILLTL